MAVVPVCYNMPYKDHTQPIQNVIKHSERGFMSECIAFADGPRCFASISSDMCRRWHGASRGLPCNGGCSIHFKGAIEVNVLQRVRLTESHLRSTSDNDLHREKFSMVCYASESSTNEKQLRSLDSYFGKLQDDAKLQSDISNKTKELHSHFRSKKELDSLEVYLSKLSEDANSENYPSSTSVEHTAEGNQAAKSSSITKNSRSGDDEEPNSYLELRSRNNGSSSLEGSQVLLQFDETSNLYLISLLVSINIAVFLFEIASPIRNSDLKLLSLPLLYGAKINDLILVGEWWRLVTPMFLHSGLFHMALGCWGLLTFGPRVCKGYGSFTFFLIFILGGISGNLISFLHTPEPTVGGTGPVFAIIGAWLSYQLQNKDVIAKDVSDSMFRKAIIVTILSFVLSNIGPIDDWTHFGAALTGTAYGFFTCPTLQLDDASSRTGQEEGITLIRRYADPCKSLIIFTIFILVLSTLLFFIEPPLYTLAVENFA
uniref:Peptidase S54 rhomboid domain-containing protein n=1 Tax=Fagus sylvatica TaxID=28930 RepID=A0A2N9FE45_FAGSY